MFTDCSVSWDNHYYSVNGHTIFWNITPVLPRLPDHVDVWSILYHHTLSKGVGGGWHPPAALQGELTPLGGSKSQTPPGVGGGIIIGKTPLLSNISKFALHPLDPTPHPPGGLVWACPCKICPEARCFKIFGEKTRWKLQSFQYNIKYWENFRFSTFFKLNFAENNKNS